MVGPRVGCYGLRLRGGNRACWWNRATISPLERRLLRRPQGRRFRAGQGVARVCSLIGRCLPLIRRRLVPVGQLNFTKVFKEGDGMALSTMQDRSGGR